jgi:hypothetical protein
VVQLHFLLEALPWTHQFKILQEGPFAITLGLDFLGRSQMIVDLAKREYYFGFAPDKVMKFICLGENEVGHVGGAESYFEQLTAEASKIVKLSSAYHELNPLGDVLCEF